MFSNPPPLPLAFTLPGSPQPPFQADPFLPGRQRGPGPPTFLALVSMLVWVGADVAGNALVVWEAEAGPVAPDPITALGADRKQDWSWGGDWPYPLPTHPHHPRAGSEPLLPLESLPLEETSTSLALQKTPGPGGFVGDLCSP